MSHAAILSRSLPASREDHGERRPACTSLSAQETGFAGVWQTELGATLALSQYGNELSGTYLAAAGESGTRASGDVTGACHGNLISFTVNWRDFQAVTSWTGRLSADGSMLQTLWLMVTETPSEQEREDIHTGADRFTRLANIVHMPGLNG